MNEGVMPTIGIDSLIQVCQLPDGSIITVKIMDTAGQERYDSVSSSYYKKADCCLLVYDITDYSSFDKIKNYYIPKIKENGQSTKKVILLGNKTDLEDKRIISLTDGASLAEKNGFIFKETSCKDNYNVADAFSTLIIMTNTELNKNKNEKGINTKITKDDNKHVNKKKKKRKFKCF